MKLLDRIQSNGFAQKISIHAKNNFLVWEPQNLKDKVWIRLKNFQIPFHMKTVPGKFRVLTPHSLLVI